MSLQLRPYQTKLVDDIRAEFARNRRVLGVASTGAGKTRVFAHITNSASAKGKRVTIIAHRDRIVAQISAALSDLGVRHGRIQAGHSMTSDPVQVGMVATLAGRLDRVPQPDLLVVDEAHHGTAGSYKRIMEAWQRCRVLGVTASPRRLDGRGLGEVFDSLVLGPPMRWLIDNQFLAAFDYLAPPQAADLSHLKTRAGDFAIDELADAMDRATVTGDAVSHYRKHLNGRPAVAFCCTVQHAEHVAQQFAEAGFRAASVDGKLSKQVIDARLNGLATGEVQVLTSCELISEGVDVPNVAGAILLRPTKSVAMYLQQVGRALRPKSDGGRAVILDHVGSVHIHGLPDAERDWSLDAKPKKQPAAPTAACKSCFQVFAAGSGFKTGVDPCGDEPGCLFADQPKRPARLPEQVEGELQAVTAPAPQPAWTGGLSLKDAKGKDWMRLLAKADTLDKLRELGEARGYKQSWAWKHHAERQSRARLRGEDMEMPFQPFVPVAELPATRKEAGPVRFVPAGDTTFDDILGA